ncbi:hypothetical protein ColKHC_07958 [Colletotrichum higginsianum]|nr:hypothetical protein ColKHC_07958 [Colletotrichum higginsianum]
MAWEMRLAWSSRPRWRRSMEPDRIRAGEVEGELCDALRLGAGDDLEGLDDAGDGLVLEARVLALGVLTDDGEVDALVAGLVAGDVLDEGDGSVDVELLAHGNVEGLVARALDGGVQDTLEAELVAAEGGDGLAEEVLGLLGVVVLRPETSTCSHSMGTLSALKMVLTLSATSAPIPSPGIRVTVYLPPNLVGLKMSEPTVA